MYKVASHYKGEFWKQGWIQLQLDYQTLRYYIMFATTFFFSQSANLQKKIINTCLFFSPYLFLLFLIIRKSWSSYIWMFCVANQSNHIKCFCQNKTQEVEPTKNCKNYQWFSKLPYLKSLTLYKTIHYLFASHQITKQILFIQHKLNIVPSSNNSSNYQWHQTNPSS
jgi:hypothetical protein